MSAGQHQGQQHIQQYIAEQSTHSRVSCSTRMHRCEAVSSAGPRSGMNWLSILRPRRKNSVVSPDLSAVQQVLVEFLTCCRIGGEDVAESMLHALALCGLVGILYNLDAVVHQVLVFIRVRHGWYTNMQQRDDDICNRAKSCCTGEAAKAGKVCRCLQALPDSILLIRPNIWANVRL